MTDQPQRSASRQFSLRAHLSFPNASQRSSAPPVSAQQQPPRAAAVAGAKAANDKASEASDDRQPKEDKGKQGQAGGAVAESQGGSQGGVSLLRVAQSPFSAWRGEGPAESSDQKDKTEVRAFCPAGVNSQIAHAYHRAIMHFWVEDAMRCAVLRWAVLCCALLCCGVQCCALLCCAVCLAAQC